MDLFCPHAFCYLGDVTQEYQTDQEWSVELSGNTSYTLSHLSSVIYNNCYYYLWDSPVLLQRSLTRDRKKNSLILNILRIHTFVLYLAKKGLQEWTDFKLPWIRGITPLDMDRHSINIMRIWPSVIISLNL